MSDRDTISAVFEAFELDIEDKQDNEKHGNSIIVADRRYFFNAAGEIVKIIGYDNQGHRLFVADQYGRKDCVGGKA